MAGKLKVLPLGGLGRDRQEHDRGRVRRPDRRRRHRADVPDPGDARDRPRAARLRLPARARRGHRGDRAHPRARGPRRRAALRAARDRHAAGDLRRPADRRHGPLEARRAQAQGRAAGGAAAGREGRARPVRARAGPPLALDPRHARGDPRHRAGQDADDRRLQVRPDAGRRPPGRHLAPRRARPRGPAAALRRLDQRRPAGDRAVGVERRPGPAGDLRRLRGTDHRHLVRLQHPPRAAGDRRRRGARPPGRPGRPLDAQELQHRLQPGHRQRALRAVHPAARDRELPRREGGRDLDRQPGRAALGAAPDGQQRPPRRRAALRRHGRLLGDAGAGQRAGGQRNDRPDLRDRRLRGHGEGRADPRLRATAGRRS